MIIIDDSDVVNGIIIDDSDDDKDNSKINSKINSDVVDDDDVDRSKKSILYHRYSLTMIELNRIITGGTILFKTSDSKINKNKFNNDNNKSGNHDDNNYDDDNNHSDNNDDNNHSDHDDKSLLTCINNINRTGMKILNYLQKYYNNYLCLLQKSQQFEAKITSYTSQLVNNHYLDNKIIIIIIINEAIQIKNEYDKLKSKSILNIIFNDNYYYVLIMSLCNNSTRSSSRCSSSMMMMMMMKNNVCSTIIKSCSDENNHIHRDDNNNDVKPIVSNDYGDIDVNNDDNKCISISINSCRYNYDDDMMKQMKDNDEIEKIRCDIMLKTDKCITVDHSDINNHHHSNSHSHNDNELSNMIIDTNNDDVKKVTNDNIDVNDNDIGCKNYIVDNKYNVVDDVDDDVNDDDSKIQLFCWCRSNTEDGYEMIECDCCREWFHFNCVGVDKKKLYCTNSSSKSSSSKKKDKSKDKSKNNDNNDNELQYVCISCYVIQGRQYLYRW